MEVPRLTSDVLLETVEPWLRAIEDDLYHSTLPADVDDLSWMKRKYSYHVNRFRYCVRENHAGYRRFGTYWVICDECGHAFFWMKEIICLQSVNPDFTKEDVYE